MSPGPCLANPPLAIVIGVISVTVRSRGGVRPAVTIATDPAAVGRFDLAALNWATPVDLAIVAVLYRLAIARGETPQVVPPIDPGVSSYLVAMGLPGHLQYDATDAPRELTGEDPLIPLLWMSEALSWDANADRLWPLLCTRLGNNVLAKQLLEIAGELADNAATHGAGPGGYAICAQQYTGVTSGLRPGIWLGLADAGIGIPEHLRRNPRYADFRDDLDLLRLAREPSVTGTPDRRGYGLGDVFDYTARAGGGLLAIESGDAGAQYIIGRDRVRSARYWRVPTRIVGTWVQLYVPA